MLLIVIIIAKLTKAKKKSVKYELSELSIHINLGESVLTAVLLDFGAFSLYPSALWNAISIYPKTETG